ncbi:MAG TPA: alpha/beta hydrolase [Myxococcota bacterium]|nr:alpha/beta hydrolase [Myxococcota bacterium]
MIRLTHGRVKLALHPLRESAGPALLCLHAVGGSGLDFAGAAAHWPGPVFGLDFSGHGDSEPLRGGAYAPEVLAGDADAALAHVGPACLAGSGVGAYVALLLAGARPDLVPAALLLPGPGLAGGGPSPDHAGRAAPRWVEDGAAAPPGSDPAVRRLEWDLRPPDYADAFARAARRLLLADGGDAPPPWWEAVRASPTAQAAPGDVAGALAQLARVGREAPQRAG